MPVVLPNPMGAVILIVDTDILVASTQLEIVAPVFVVVGACLDALTLVAVVDT